MGLRLIIGVEQGDSRDTPLCDKVVMFNSVTAWAFGPVFSDDDEGRSAADQAEGFMAYVAEQTNTDARACDIPRLDQLHTHWIAAGKPGIAG